MRQIPLMILIFLTGCVQEDDQYNCLDQQIICGIDQNSYRACDATRKGIQIVYTGPCDSCEPVTCELLCPNGYQKDENGCKTCICIEPTGCTQNSDCPEGEYCAFTSCNNALAENCNLSGECLPNNCGCAAVYEPVCGEDHKTYLNECLATCNNTLIAHTGDCITCATESCNLICNTDQEMSFADNGCSLCECN